MKSKDILENNLKVELNIPMKQDVFILEGDFVKRDFLEPCK